MEIYAELKLREDACAGGFANGLTMCQSQSTVELEKILENESETVWQNGRGHRVTVHKRKLADAEEICTTFENNGGTETVLEMLASFAVRGIKADKIHRIQSFWSAEGRLKTDTVEELQLVPSWSGHGFRTEKFGNLGSMPVRKYFPFVALEDSGTGLVTGIQLYLASSWQMELICRRDETISVAGGIADRDFGHWAKKVAPGESFTTPRAVIAQGSSLYEVCDKLVKAQHPDISPVDDHMGIVFNEYCTTWGNPCMENVRKICGQLKGRPVQFLVIDAGWYGNGDDWWEHIGDWDVDRNKFPGGLKEAADYIKSCGMVPGLWFELESVNRKSIHYHDGEHLLKKDGVVITDDGKRFWDMADPWVIDYLSQKVIGLLKECGFGYLKVDYNDTIGIGCDGAESLGEGLRQKVAATQEFFRKIRQEIPDIVIENCSSGGHRLEPSMMELVSQASFSDAHETKSIPLIAANLQRVIRPEQSQIWAVVRKEDDADRIHYSIINTLFGRFGLSGDIYDLSGEQWKMIDEGIAFYQAASDIIKYGKTISVLSTVSSCNKPSGYQIVERQWGRRMLLTAHRFADSGEIPDPVPQGYRIEREYGEISRDFSAKAWILKETDG